MIDTEQIAHWTHAIKNSGYSEKEIEADLKSLNNLLADYKRLREEIGDWALVYKQLQEENRELEKIIRESEEDWGDE